MQLVTLDASNASNAVRSVLTKIQDDNQKLWMTVAALIFAGLIAVPFISNGSAQDSAGSLLLLGVICAVAAGSFYRARRYEMVGEFFRFLGFEGNRAAGPAAYSQWIGAGIGEHVQLPYYGSLADIFSWIDRYRRSNCGLHYRLFSGGIARTILSTLLLALAAACFLAIPILFFVGAVGSVWVIAAIAIVVLFISGRESLKFGRRMMQPSAEKLLTEDLREPVLWLRAFRDDGASILNADRASFEQDRSLEEILAFDLWYYGPVVAIGAPGERLPRVGAARGYFADSDWQNAVRHWMSLARLIVVVVGTTEWLRWEVETAMNAEYLSKVIFVFPPDTASNRTERWSNTIRPLQSHGKYKELSQLDVRLARVGHFRSDNTFILITDPAKDNVAYEVASRLAVYGMFSRPTIAAPIPDIFVS